VIGHALDFADALHLAGQSHLTDAGVGIGCDNRMSAAIACRRQSRVGGNRVPATIACRSVA
jgi:hypothetical protein